MVVVSLFSFGYQWVPKSHQEDPYLPSVQTESSPQDAPPAHLSQDDCCSPAGSRTANPGEHAKGLRAVHILVLKCVSYKNIYASSCSMQTASCIYWFQMPVSSSSGSSLCYINKSQPLRPQQATLRYVCAPSWQSIKSKYNVTEKEWTSWPLQSCFKNVL